MAKFAHDLVYEASLDYIIANANSLRLCSADILTGGVPDYTKITGAAALTGPVAVIPGNFTKQEGLVSGRRATMVAKVDVPLTVTGVADYVCLLNTTNTRVLWVTDCVSQNVVSGNNITVPTWDIEFRDPA